MSERKNIYDIQNNNQADVDGGCSEEPCIICGRAVNHDKKLLYVSINWRGDLFTPEESENNEEVSCYPIGNGCYKKHKNFLSGLVN